VALGQWDQEDNQAHQVSEDQMETLEQLVSEGLLVQLVLLDLVDLSVDLVQQVPQDHLVLLVQLVFKAFLDQEGQVDSQDLLDQ